MTYPQQYQQPQQMPGFPQAPAQPQYPQAPQQYPAAPQPQYPQPQQYGPPQGYPQQYAQPQQAPQLASGTLDAYYQQPSSGGGAALKFDPGTRHVGIVTRPITNADIQQQTTPGSGLPAFFKDGRPKFVMKVPLQLQPTPDRPDGLAQWYVAGGARDELVRAMAEAGAPEGPPEAGAVIDITCTGTRPAGSGMNPAKVYRVHYQRPNGAQPAAAPAPQQAVAAPQPAPQQAVPAQQPPVPQAPVAQAAPPAPAPVATSGLSAEQQALLAQLTGQPTG